MRLELEPDGQPPPVLTAAARPLAQDAFASYSGPYSPQRANSAQQPALGPGGSPGTEMGNHLHGCGGTSGSDCDIRMPAHANGDSAPCPALLSLPSGASGHGAGGAVHLASAAKSGSAADAAAGVAAVLQDSHAAEPDFAPWSSPRVADSGEQLIASQTLAVSASIPPLRSELYATRPTGPDMASLGAAPDLALFGAGGSTLARAFVVSIESALNLRPPDPDHNPPNPTTSALAASSGGSGKDVGAAALTAFVAFVWPPTGERVVSPTAAVMLRQEAGCCAEASPGSRTTFGSLSVPARGIARWGFTQSLLGPASDRLLRGILEVQVWLRQGGRGEEEEGFSRSSAPTGPPSAGAPRDEAAAAADAGSIGTGLAGAQREGIPGLDVGLGTAAIASGELCAAAGAADARAARAEAGMAGAVESGTGSGQEDGGRADVLLGVARLDLALVGCLGELRGWYNICGLRCSWGFASPDASRWG